MLDDSALMERIQAQRQSIDLDHAYEREKDLFSVPLAERLSQFRLEGTGCDIEFVVGIEEKVSYGLQNAGHFRDTASCWHMWFAVSC